MTMQKKESVARIAFSIYSNQLEPRSTVEEQQVRMHDLNELINHDRLQTIASKQQRQFRKATIEKDLVHSTIKALLEKKK